MIPLSSNALCTKAKAMQKNRITHDKYIELTKKQSIAEFVAYLKTQSGYQESLKAINEKNVHRRELEKQLRQEYFGRCLKLMKYAPKKHQEFYLKPLMEIEINMILDKISNILSTKESELPMISKQVASKCCFDTNGFINITSYQGLMQYLKPTKYYKILKKYDLDQHKEEYGSLKKELKEYFYQDYEDTIKRCFKGKMKKQLLDVLYTTIEIKNIVNIYRMKKYFDVSDEKMQEVLFLQFNRMPRSFMEHLLHAKNEKEVLKLLVDSPYQLYVDEKDEYIYIEYYMEEIRFHIAKRFMRFSSKAPLVYMTYNVLHKIEIDNLKHIIEGIRYNRSPESIQEMLIDV